MRNILKGLKLFMLVCVVTFSPIYFLKILTDSKKILYSNKYEKVKVKIDSIALLYSTIGSGTGVPARRVYFNNYEDNIIINDYSKEFFSTKKQTETLSHFFKYSKLHNDSIWIWKNPHLIDEYAKYEDEKYDNSNRGFLIFINFALLILSIYLIIHFIKWWRTR